MTSNKKKDKNTLDKQWTEKTSGICQKKVLK